MMNRTVLCLFVVLLVPFLQYSYADIEKGANYDKEVIGKTAKNADIIKFSALPYQRIQDEQGNWQDYLFADQGAYLEAKTANNSIRLDKSSCAFSHVDNNGNTKMSDSIVAFNSVVDMYSWNAVTQVNSAACEAYFDAGNNALVAKKYAAGVGYMEYKYIFLGGKIKTQLEATNLTGLTDRVFAFDQTVNLNSDTITFGGSVIDLDLHDGETFQRTWLENNQARVINLMTGEKFDFDLGFEYLDSVTVIDNGQNSSKLVFHYMRNNEVLMPNQTLIIDPTYNELATAEGRVSSAGATGTACPSYGSNLTDLYAYKTDSTSAAANSCQVAYFQFDLSALSPGWAVDSAYIEYDVITISNAVPCQVLISSTNTVGSSMYDDGVFTGSGVNATNESATCETVADGKQESFLSSSFATLESRFGDTVTILITVAQNPREPGLEQFSQFRTSDAVLNIVYTVVDPSEFDVAINTYTVGDTAKINGTVTLTKGFPFPITLDSIQILRNDTQINLNNTNGTFTGLGQTINFGSIWNQMTTGATFNFTAVATVDNATDSQITNSSSSFTSREYDPTYAPAIDSPTTQGNVNATIERFDSDDGLLLKVNRIGVSTGDEWQIECIAQTNSQAAASKNQSAAQQGTWRNQTDTGYFNTTFTGFTNSHAYVTCYNDDLLFTLTDFTDSSLALLGIALFDESYGSMIGVPVGIFFLVMTAGMANKRTAPTFIILITGIAGTMATIGFFSFEPLVWGLALVTAMLGIFVNQKIF